MTCIVKFPTKKALRDAIAEGKTNFWIEDPSIFDPRVFTPTEMQIGESVVVTNHLKRSWFAKIARTKNGYKVT